MACQGIVAAWLVKALQQHGLSRHCSSMACQGIVAAWLVKALQQYGDTGHCSSMASLLVRQCKIVQAARP